MRPSRWTITALLLLVATSTLTLAPTVGSTASIHFGLPPRAVAPAGAVEVRVLHYNIHYGNGGLEQLARDIERADPDVVLLNEVDTHDRPGGVHQARWFARRLGMRVAYDANIRFAWGQRGNAVLTRYTIDEVTRFDLYVPAGSRPRGLMRVRLSAQDMRFDVWTTHLNPGVGRLRQAEGVRQQIGAPPCATVLGGDLNARPDTPIRRAVSTHLRDLWEVAGRGTGETNFHGTKRIDYLFYARATPRGAWVAPRRHSDHRALVGVLHLDRADSC